MYDNGNIAEGLIRMKRACLMVILTGFIPSLMIIGLFAMAYSSSSSRDYWLGATFSSDYSNHWFLSAVTIDRYYIRSVF